MKQFSIYVNNICIAQKANLANNFLTRLNGLMFKKSFSGFDGLIIYPCNSIHMFFMNFPIDVLFVDEKDEIIDLLENFQPNKISKLYKNAKYVVELPKNTIKSFKIKKNEKILFKSLDK